MSELQYPKVAVILLNWNGKHWLERFLPFVTRSTYPALEIWVVDNASTDESVAYVQSEFPQVKTLVLDKNYGFTQGNNLALPHIDTPYYILLNSDVEVSPGWVEPMAEYMEQHPDTGVIQPKILAHHAKDTFEYAGAAGGWIDSLGYPFCKGRVFEFIEKDEKQYDKTSEIFWASGACCMIRKSVTDKTGLFEPSFFAHMEEIDFCWRVKNYGFKIIYQPQSVVWHVGGGTLNKTNPRKTFLNIRNSLSVLVRNLPAYQILPKVFLRLCLDGVFAVTLLLRGDFPNIRAILQAHFAFYGMLGYLLKSRKSLLVPPSSFPTTGTFGGSIVFEHFVRGKKVFHEIVKH
ncbi:MAG: glycosyltransferase family 2 protein [Bacteroidia bacterium]|nr:glycosyltransferase family 2 protein [Bacteroidia bacterium]